VKTIAEDKLLCISFLLQKLASSCRQKLMTRKFKKKCAFHQKIIAQLNNSSALQCKWSQI